MSILAHFSLRPVSNADAEGLEFTISPPPACPVLVLIEFFDNFDNFLTTFEQGLDNFLTIFGNFLTTF
jgi:hypothetical protein